MDLVFLCLLNVNYTYVIVNDYCCVVNIIRNYNELKTISINNARLFSFSLVTYESK